MEVILVGGIEILRIRKMRLIMQDIGRKMINRHKFLFIEVMESFSANGHMGMIRKKEKDRR